MKVLFKIGVVSIFLLLVAQLCFSAPAQEKGKFHVRISIYEIPNMIISRIVSTKIADDGSVTGTMVGGDITSSFPPGVVLLQNRLSDSPIDDPVIKVIRENMASNCVRLQDIQVIALAQHDFLLDAMESESQEVYQDLTSSGIEYHYRLRVVLEWKNEEEVCLALQLWMNRKNPDSIQLIGVEIPAPLVLDLTVTAKFDQTSLVGFPSYGKKPRDTIYWLAISTKKQ